MTKTIDPYSWHKKPSGCSPSDACSICGLTQKVTGSHRLTREDEGYERQYVLRKKTSSGWEFKELGRLWHVEYQRGMSAKTAERITQATAMLARGATRNEIAEKLGVSPQAVKMWEYTHREVWQKALDAAMIKMVEVVRTEAGTDAIMRDPTEFLRMATIADKWTERAGVALFDAHGEQTLSTFYESYYRPVVIPELKGQSLGHFTRAVKRWRLFTGDPPITSITPVILAKYRDVLAKLRGRYSYTKAVASTVANGLACIQSILDKAGPPGYRNRDGAGIIATVPYVKPPRIILPERKIVSMEQLDAVYQSAIAMDHPEIDGVKPAAWWRALIITAVYTGLRRGTLMSLRMTDIDWKNRTITVPADRMKSRRPHQIPMHPIVVDHLHRIRTDREIVFQWDRCTRQFYQQLHKLQKAAGIPRSQHFGLHGLRRTLATWLYEINPGAARQALGHAAMAVTETHYVRGDEMVVRAMDRLPQPAAFTRT